MTTSCLTRRPVRKPQQQPPAPKYAPPAQPELWTQDLSAAQNLMRSRQYSQALVLAAALKRLYGDRRELTQMITACRSHLSASA
ncbi:hypothetical protein SAMN04488040_3367 [Sulfitobacter marinus]|uniref:Uncharacterized protein n=1 Tax=Sulfitobacter marinus TaxID=394264 RepID=A0A1I6VJI7_9RHOB|nr:hypothetical protein [Sulfitobacter marinus]SFT13817.1 hypothetical protein SAMN04488040_3367 [Sulfitobacter marinus]